MIRDIDGTIEHGLKDDAFSRVFGVYAGGKVQKPGYSEKLLSAVYPDDAVPKEAVKHIEEYIEQRLKLLPQNRLLYGGTIFLILEICKLVRKCKHSP